MTLGVRMIYHHFTYPMDVDADVPLTDNHRSMLAALEAYDLSFLAERLERKQLVPADHIERAILEFKRYMALIGLGYRGIGMINPEVDEVWHTFILFTRKYHQFCEEIFGEFIHHTPETSAEPLPPGRGAKFINAYTRVFGDLDPIWQAGPNGLAAKSDCKPSTNCQDAECDDGLQW